MLYKTTCLAQHNYGTSETKAILLKDYLKLYKELPYKEADMLPSR